MFMYLIWSEKSDLSLRIYFASVGVNRDTQAASERCRAVPVGRQQARNPRWRSSSRLCKALPAQAHQALAARQARPGASCTGGQCPTAISADPQQRPGADGACPGACLAACQSRSQGLEPAPTGPRNVRVSGDIQGVGPMLKSADAGARAHHMRRIL